ncbi:MAG: hypothetical protein ABIJ97_12245 [Bacteroidota bacterium]
MNNLNSSYDILLRLKEREKELNCIYQIDNVLRNYDEDTASVFNKLLLIIPDGWQYPNICKVEIKYNDVSYRSPCYIETKWSYSADIIFENNLEGYIKILYSELCDDQNNYFLPEEIKLLNAIADRIGIYLFHKKAGSLLKIISENKIHTPSDFIDLLHNDQIHWKWRDYIIREAVEMTNFEELGIFGIYLAGSTKNATSGPASDIDIIVHYSGKSFDKKMICNWFNGWSYCLNAWNYEKTGIKSNHGLIDLHLITDKDINNKTSFAVMINSMINSAKPIKIINRND